MRNGKNNYIKRAARIQQIVSEHYEPENQAKCKRAVFRHHVNPIYPMSERTFWRYMAVRCGDKHSPLGEDTGQLRLF